MKLFLIIVVHGIVGGTAGPVPYDLAQCQEYAQQDTEKFQAVPENRLGFEFICEYRSDRPKLGDVYYPTK